MQVEGLRLQGRALGGAEHTETEAVVGIDGPSVVAVGRAAVPGSFAPGAAAQQPFLMLMCVRIKPRSAIIRGIKIVWMPRIAALFPPIAMHIVQPPGASSKAAYFRGALARAGPLGRRCQLGQSRPRLRAAWAA